MSKLIFWSPLQCGIQGLMYGGRVGKGGKSSKSTKIGLTQCKRASGKLRRLGEGGANSFFAHSSPGSATCQLGQCFVNYKYCQIIVIVMFF